VLIQARTRHSTSAEVTARLAAEQPLTPGDAAAVAAWYQAPASHGAVFACLASGLPTDSAEVIDAVAREIPCVPAIDVPALIALAVWAAEQ